MSAPAKLLTIIFHSVAFAQFLIPQKVEGANEI